MRVRTAAPPMFSGISPVISVYRCTSTMKCIFHDKRAPYGMWVEIATQFIARYSMQWWCRQNYHPESYSWKLFET